MFSETPHRNNMYRHTDYLQMQLIYIYRVRIIIDGIIKLKRRLYCGQTGNE